MTLTINMESRFINYVSGENKVEAKDWMPELNVKQIKSK